MQQLTIPGLFDAAAPDDKSPEQACIDWLCGTHGCASDVAPHVHRLFETFSRSEAFNRSSLLQVLSGRCQKEGWSLSDAEFVGLYDKGITDYHVIWDRRWAIVMLMPKELVPRVQRCSYGGNPKFYDKDGALLYEGAYLDHGIILTDEERRQAMADRERGDGEPGNIHHR